MRAAASSLLELTLRQGVQLAIFIVLARLISPADFGVVSMGLAIVLVVSAVADLGLTTALVRCPDLTRELFSTAFWTSVVSGLFFTCLTVLAAPFAAEVTDMSELRTVLPTLSVIVLLSCLASAPIANLTRELRFHLLAVISTTAAAASGVVSVTIAVAGSGLWALTAQAVTMALLTTIGLWATTRHRPARQWSWPELRGLLAFGRYVVATTTLDAFASRVPLLAIGTVYGPTTLGQYSRAETTQMAITDFTSSVVGRVALPVFSGSAVTPEPLRAGARTGLRFGLAMNAPLMLIAGAVGPQLITGLFGPAWESAGTLFSILCLAGAFWPVHVVAVNLLLAMGRSREVFGLDVAKKSLLLVALAVGLPFGAVGVAWAQVAYAVGASWINSRAIARAVDYPVRAQVRDSGSPVLVAALASAVAWALTLALPGGQLVVAGVAAATGAVVYLSLAYACRVSPVIDLAARAGRLWDDRAAN